VAVKDGEVVWSETYDRVLNDVFALQSEIAQTVAVALVAEVAGASEAERAAAAQKQIGGTQNVAAYEAFLRGHALYDLSSGSEADRAALAQFDAAIAADPNYAAAHAMRSTMLAALGINLASGEGEHDQIFDDAIAAAKRALAIEPRLARGHVALGYALSHGRLESAAALSHYRSAEENAAGDADIKRAVAGFLMYGADQTRAQALIAEVLALDPLNARAFRSAGYIDIFARQYAEVVTHMERAIALNPSIASAQFGIAIARLMQGDNAGALKAAEAEPAKAFALTAVAIAKHRMGDTAGAEAALATMQRDFDGSHYQQAEVNAQIGRPAEALKWLETAYAKRDPGLLWLRNDPLLDPLRGEAQFKDLLSRLGS
jgi:Tfp pilus assembly protein PilF